MAVVIRLQGLDVTAGTEDIRKFFTGLKIPDGGVHIIGGELDEAFIVFASDEDARRAMTRSGGLIRGSSVVLLLSSKAEMQSVLEMTTQNAELEEKRPFDKYTGHAGTSIDSEVSRTSSGQTGYGDSSTKGFFGLFLNGMPFTVTEAEIRNFFSGLQVTEIVMLKNYKGKQNGKGFVNFSTKQDSLEALKRHRGYIGSRYVEVLETTAKDWYRASGTMPMVVNAEDKRGRSPVHHQRNPHHTRSRSPVARRQASPPEEEYCVMLGNLSFTVAKTDVKDIFRHARLKDDQIMLLTDRDGKRSGSAFVLFDNRHDYREALSQKERLISNRWVSCQAISREDMIKLLESHSLANRPAGNSRRSQERPPSHVGDDLNSEKLCVFVRNLPFDVRKVEIIDFFYGFNVTEDKVWVLSDHKGAGVGQALVLFRSELEAKRALSLNGQRFLGSEVVMKCISRDQMKQLAAETPTMLAPSSKEEQYLSRHGERSESTSRQIDSFYYGSRSPMDGKVSTYRPGHFREDDYKPQTSQSRSPQNRGNGIRDNFGRSGQNFDSPTQVLLSNIPFQIRDEEIYDFCYGYRVIPGSVSLQRDYMGRPRGTATLMFESRQEAMSAIRELDGRPIGSRKIQLSLA